jgi:hypothetical protein
VIGVSPALAATGWTIVPAPPTGQNAAFTAVTTTSDSSAWAVGSENAELNGVGAKALIDHWNGTAWSRVTVPQPSGDGLNSNLDAISADGPNDVWIVGTYEDKISSTFFPNETYSPHWNGSTWSVVPMPLVGSSNVNAFFQSNSIQVNSPTDVWAVGYYDPTGTAQGQTLTLNWNASAWVTVASPNASSGFSVLDSVATTPGATIVQAVGDSGASGATNPLALQNG